MGKTVFSQSVLEKIESYVYFLQHPITGDIFYVGKGTGNRVFQHMACAVETDGETEKLETVRSILAMGKQPIHYILRHGLTSGAAFEIEAALIDFIGMNKLSNLQGGRNSGDYGLTTAEEISARYEACELVTNQPCILININRLYRREMTDQELYDATRQSWVLGNRREKAQYAVATYRGLTREVYEIERWFKVEANARIRWGFDGKIAAEAIRQQIRYKSISSYFRKGSANPVKYLNC